jgi:hypothetical protein
MLSCVGYCIGMAFLIKLRGKLREMVLIWLFFYEFLHVVLDQHFIQSLDIFHN